MKDRLFVLGWGAVAFALFFGVLTLARNDPSPKPKPELEMTITHTNADATVFTYVKNGHNITWGFAIVNNQTFVLLPIIE